jgi:hypothetical protein
MLIHMTMHCNPHKADLLCILLVNMSNQNVVSVTICTFKYPFVP